MRRRRQIFINGLMPADLRNQNPAMEMAATASAAPALSVVSEQADKL